MIADVPAPGGGLDVARLLARANLITNKSLLPNDRPEDWGRPGGLRLGTIEGTRLGMREPQMEKIADIIARLLIDKESPQSAMEDVVEFHQPYQRLYCCFDK